MTNSFTLSKMRALGVDYGLKNIGLAISDENKIVAGKLGNIVNYGELPTFNEIQKIIDIYKVNIVVLGYPYYYNRKTLEGTDQEPKETIIQAKLRRLKLYMEKKSKVKVDYWDESFSSKIVEKYLRGKDKKRSDSEVAKFILQEYLDHKIMMRRLKKRGLK